MKHALGAELVEELRNRDALVVREVLREAPVVRGFQTKIELAAHRLAEAFDRAGQGEEPNRRHHAHELRAHHQEHQIAFDLQTRERSLHLQRDLRSVVE